VPDTFTILFNFSDESKQFPFATGFTNFQATVQHNNNDCIYYISKIHKYDIYEMVELIGTYTISSFTISNTSTPIWKDVKTNAINPFIQAIGEAIVAYDVNKIPISSIY